MSSTTSASGTPPLRAAVRAVVRAAAATVTGVRRTRDSQRVAALTAVTAAAVVGTGTPDLEGLLGAPAAQQRPASVAPAGDTAAAPPVQRPRSVAALITLVFPPGERRHALQVARCESGLRSVRSPRNADGSRDWGVFQINDGAGRPAASTLRRLGGDPAAALDPAWNVRAAKRLWAARGWQPWTCGRSLGLA